MMQGWEKIILGNHIDTLTDYHANGSYKKLKENVTLKNEPSYCIMVRTLNFERNDFSNDLIYIDETEYNFLSKSKVFSGDILMNKIAQAGSVYLMPKINQPASLAMNLFLIRFDNTLDQLFMYYLMKVNENYIKQFANGTATTTITKEAVRNLSFIVPSLNVQRKIANILSAYDDLIENNLKSIKLLGEKAQLTYEQWFLYRIIDNTVISDKNIKIDTLENLIVKYINGGWGKEENEGNYTNEAYVIRGTDMPKVSMGQFDELPLRFHTESNLKSRILKHGDIAIEMSNGNIDNVGRSFYFDIGLSEILNKPTICASFCKMLRPKSVELSYLIDAHLKYIYSSNKMLVYKVQAANGINNFNFEEMIRDEELFIPEGENLNILVNSIKSCYKLISNIRIQNQYLKEARDILLPRLMTGMIDVKKINVESLKLTSV
ncbi:restriction endonuclease subunit S [Aestuariivivens marinum]|uniref:restriction endonuclease subunit S n=1 Tax=Aestuariivivens marinum TaxID=2913555 RepID=UPI001F578299|nr:restriction endonuclease subunit S [Aestuariivivens marinum]